jgi:CHASE2 domain-containing sensor protein
VLEVVALGPAIFAAAGPSFFTTREFANSPDRKGDIRFAEVFGTTITMTLAISAGLLVEGQEMDWAPVVAGLLISGTMIGMYEYALAHPRAGSSMTNPQQPAVPDYGGLNLAA